MISFTNGESGSSQNTLINSEMKNRNSLRREIKRGLSHGAFITNNSSLNSQINNENTEGLMKIVEDIFEKFKNEINRSNDQTASIQVGPYEVYSPGSMFSPGKKTSLNLFAVTKYVKNLLKKELGYEAISQKELERSPSKGAIIELKATQIPAYVLEIEKASRSFMGLETFLTKVGRDNWHDFDLHEVRRIVMNVVKKIENNMKATNDETCKVEIGPVVVIGRGTMFSDGLKSSVNFTKLIPIINTALAENSGLTISSFVDNVKSESMLSTPKEGAVITVTVSKK